jgi:hypothetical protein
VWNGMKWSLQTAPNPAAVVDALDAVSCPSLTHCESVGFYYNSSDVKVTLAEVWDGSSWSVQTTPNRTGAQLSTLYSLSCAGTTDCEAVGYDHNTSGAAVTLAEKWNGTKWNLQPSVNPSGLARVLSSVSCPSSTDCESVGFHDNSSDVGKTLAEVWNGTSWSVQTTPNPA